MSTTPQTLTLAGKDYVVIRRDEYEQLRAAADEGRYRCRHHPARPR